VGPGKVSTVRIIITAASCGVAHLSLVSASILGSYTKIIWKNEWTVWIRSIHHSGHSKLRPVPSETRKAPTDGNDYSPLTYGRMHAVLEDGWGLL
jgi:hypothetical protein